VSSIEDDGIQKDWKKNVLRMRDRTRALATTSSSSLIHPHRR